MGKYNDIETTVYAIFDTSAWKANGISTYPTNYGSNNSQEFIRVNVIPSGIGINRRSGSGLLQIDIFIEAGKGSKRITQISDLLDAHLSGYFKTISGGPSLQFFGSSLAFRGLDEDNPALYRALFSTPFQYYSPEV